jgi:hypothetical protein
MLGYSIYYLGYKIKENGIGGTSGMQGVLEIHFGFLLGKKFEERDYLENVGVEGRIY